VAGPLTIELTTVVALELLLDGDGLFDAPLLPLSFLQEIVRANNKRLKLFEAINHRCFIITIIIKA
jgi:hypothetical protein